MKKRLNYFIYCVLSALILTSCGGSGESHNDRYSEGYESGESQGYQDGYSDGHNDGYSEGLEDGTSEGYQDGYSEGHGDGYSEGLEDGTSEGYQDGYSDGYGDASSEGYEEGFYDNEPEYSIHTVEQSNYLNGTSLDVNSSITGLEEKSKPLGINIVAPKDNRYKASDVNRYLLKLSLSKDMSDPYVYENPNNSSFSLKNLNIGKRYFYTIEAVTNTETYSTSVKSFSISDQAPRNLDIDGVTNARDVGGWKIEGEDRTTVQNLFYRTARLHDDYVDNITDAGKNEIHRLGIKTEIDLRDPKSGGLTKLRSAVEGLDYYNCGMVGINYWTNEIDKTGIKETFDVLSDVNNYPVLYHCAIGTDRTGFITFLIDCLAGVSFDDMCRDYVFSCFGNINGQRNANTIQDYVDHLNNNYGGGGDLARGAFNYLRELGVSEGKIRIVQNMIIKGYDDCEHTVSEEWEASSHYGNLYHEKVCLDSNCGAVIHKEKHNYSETNVEIAPTLNTDGKGSHYCLECGYEEDIVLPKTGGDVNYLGMHTYGNSATFTIKTDCELTNINGEKTSLDLYVDDQRLEGVTYEYSKSNTNNFSTIKFNLSKTVNVGDVVKIKKGSILSNGQQHLVITKDIDLTYNGTAFYPSFLLDKNPTSVRRTANSIYIEYHADFTEFTDGQAANGLQPYYTYKNGKGSDFTYSITRNGSVVKTYENDCVNGAFDGEVTTSLFWTTAQLLRIKFNFVQTSFQEGDVLRIHKGSTYSDNGGHVGHIDDVKKYILSEDLFLVYDAADEVFIPVLD